MVSKTRVGAAIAIISLTVSVSSCMTAPVTVTSSTTPLIDKAIGVNHGRVQGTNRTWSLFGLWMFKRPDIDKAIQDALAKKGGDALINVSCYEKTAWFLFFSLHWVVIEGDAVSFAPPIDEKKQKKGR